MKHSATLKEAARKKKEAMAVKSFINRENGLGGPAKHLEYGYPKKRRAVIHIGIPIKTIGIRKDDWVTLHRYVDMKQIYMTDALHELIEPLKAVIEKEQTSL